MEMKTAEFDYNLPANLIAQHPLEDRAAARMMVLRRDTGSIEHRCVRELPCFLQSGDLLVVNDTRVIPARILGKRTDTGGKVELLLLEQCGPNVWRALCRARRRPQMGSQLTLADGRVQAEVLSLEPEGRTTVRLECRETLVDVLEEVGLTPLPPYIKRPDGPEPADRERYQTVYATNPGAVAAPTAGLHMTTDLLDQLAARGVARTAITLHVGPGTFRPVTAELVEEHVMESERSEVSPETAEKVNRTREEGGRVIAVGTTTVRTLESAAADGGMVRTFSGRTDLFIRPPYAFKAVDCMLTNFHLPKSTLLMMISAFAGRDLIMKAYHEAVEAGYRFYSYGDCMLIL
jgi:S-adenosylmethionine:tRNA ribosyltransferase-isomerase